MGIQRDFWDYRNFKGCSGIFQGFLSDAAMHKFCACFRMTRSLVEMVYTLAVGQILRESQDLPKLHNIMLTLKCKKRALFRSKTLQRPPIKDTGNEMHLLPRITEQFFVPFFRFILCDLIVLLNDIMNLLGYNTVT